MLVTLIPLFDEEMSVRAYSLFTQKKNTLLNPSLQGTRQHDGAVDIPGLEVLESMGIETIPSDKEIFVEINNLYLPTLKLRLRHLINVLCCLWIIRFCLRRFM